MDVCSGAIGAYVHFNFMKQDYWETAYSRMQREEDNDFIYKKWFRVNGFANFKADTITFPSRKHIVSKIDKLKPFSPTNFQWVIKPKIDISNRVSNYVQKDEYNCYTLILKISKDVNLKSSGIYKLTFDNGCFYIGSTGNFKKRVNCFVGSFRGSSPMHNKQMIKCVVDCDIVTFEVVKYVDDIYLLKQEETLEIKKHIGNSLLLNRAYDANSNRGIKWTDEEKKKTKASLIAKFKSGELKAGTHSRGRRRKGTFKSKIL